MKLNRRNVLIGLGGLTIGGGALLGSGAFSSIEAERTVEVEITDDVAEYFVDVRIDAGEYGTVDVQDNGDTQDPDDLEPTGESQVSLIDNDVTILFAGEDGLPPNANVNYDDLFFLVNDDDDTEDDFNVELDLEDETFLDIDIDDGGEDVGAGETVSLDATVDTEEDDEEDTLHLIITQA